MRIGELAERAGVSVRSLRYYEEQGLLASVRSASGQRHYTEAQVARVLFIQRLYAAGLSSRTIVELLPCVDAPSEEHALDALDRMAQERARLDAHITELAQTRDALDEVMAGARKALAVLREQPNPAVEPSNREPSREATPAANAH
ncbi:MerR family transcriptional regulator [Actinomadura rupiterrae]|uniref:MerR family transcriptional regulator n=1 Tax=Actinomadura rupiterrae TaxID=559627 RepID=UPI0020A5763A|nr:MerR family transcriptional regulator [Actinomadura rupiterrae]MCP2342097.1 DNA-binding transcriptional MerR regulator [Actinomadura rupiterrae]